MSETGADGGVALHCRPLKEGDALVFPYEVTNAGRGDVYVMDAVPGLDPATGQPTLDANAAVIWQAEDGFLTIMKGIAPLPTDRSVAVRVIPLAAKLAPGAVLQRRLTLGLPLHETGPYHPDLPVRDYRQREIGGIVLRVQFLPASLEGFGAVPADGAPDLYRVMTRNTVGQVRTVSCRLPARSLHVLRRTDEFPRPP